ncbi:MAG: glycoside hydrolase family 1 protein [Chloroflexi bacterium]|nr:glycoside hydrolase family 1 protein [Chloroflexota bacterium]
MADPGDVRRPKRLSFPAGFFWGSATSAYQVEGGIENCDWAKLYPAGRACDHYNRYEEDLDLTKHLNQNAYRFSIEWSRIEPEEGKWNEREIAHYRKVIQSLRERKLEPFVTLHHFTSPQWFATKGGFEKQSNVFFFVRFATRLLQEYGDLVSFWITINEPSIYAYQGYFKGIWPPQKRSVVSSLRVARNLIAAHREVYKQFHSLRPDVNIGIAHNMYFFEPFHKHSPLDRFVVALCWRIWNDHILRQIKTCQDFVGLNYYFHGKLMFPGLQRNEKRIVSDIGWEVYSEGIYGILKRLRKYRLPIYITENGLADAKDKLRGDFIKDHLTWIHRAIEEGVDVKGYFHWSLIDNFEWEKGFGPRFGLVEIDYETLERKCRPSAHYYSEICKNNALVI